MEFEKPTVAQAIISRHQMHNWQSKKYDNYYQLCQYDTISHIYHPLPYRDQYQNLINFTADNSQWKKEQVLGDARS